MATTIITAQQGFDETYYLQAKAAQMGVSVSQALAAITAAGLTPAEHYSLYGYAEGLSPNAYFNETQYASSKAAAAGISAAQFEIAWYNASGSTNLYLHYLQYGAFEDNVNPSTGFNDLSYYTAKAAQMGSGYTWQDARDAIQAAGMTALSHYLLYGINESLSYTPTGSSPAGTTYTLTTGQDTINGGSSDNIINGVLGTNITTSTLQPMDVINAGSGTNTLNVVTTTAAYGLGAGSTPVLNGVTILNVTDTAAQAHVLTGLTPDLTTIGIVGQTANATFAGVSTNVTTLNFTNDITGCTDGFTYLAGLTGTSDTLTINASGNTTAAGGAGVTGLTVTGAAVNDGFDLVTVNSTGSASRFTFLTVQDSAATSTMTKLTITGNAGFQIDTALDFKGTTGTVDASAATGSVKLAFGVGENDTVTGGSGNDRFAFAAGALTTDDVIDGGTGTNTLAIADVTVNSTTTTLNSAITAAKNINTLEFTGATATLDASTLAITDYKFTTTAAGAITVTNAETDTFTISGRVAGATAITPKAGTITGNLTIAGSTTAVAGTAALTVTGYNTFNIASTGTTGVGANTITGNYTTSAGATTNITGSQDLSIANVAVTGTVDASTFTGNLTVTASAAAVTLLGGSGNDILNGSAATDTINGGAGNDVITGGVGKDVIVTGTGIDTVNIGATDSLATGIGAAGDALTKTFVQASGTAYQSITAETGDTIVFTTAAVGTANSVNDLGATAALEGSAIAKNGVEYWTNGGNTYVAVDIDGSGTLTAADTLVELSGVHTFSSSAIAATSLSLTLTS